MPRFLLIVNHDPGLTQAPPMDEWAPDEVAAHMNYYAALNRELIESGELVGVTILADPRQARIVHCDGASSAVVTDGPYPESKEVVAGFQVVDVESEARAIEIAARVSAVPGPAGVPIQQPIEVRQVMSGSAEEP
jgi:hypothetical protein